MGIGEAIGGLVGGLFGMFGNEEASSGYEQAGQTWQNLYNLLEPGYQAALALGPEINQYYGLGQSALQQGQQAINYTMPYYINAVQQAANQAAMTTQGYLQPELDALTQGYNMAGSVLSPTIGLSDRASPQIESLLNNPDSIYESGMYQALNQQAVDAQLQNAAALGMGQSGYNQQAVADVSADSAYKYWQGLLSGWQNQQNLGTQARSTLAGLANQLGTGKAGAYSNAGTNMSGVYSNLAALLAQLGSQYTTQQAWNYQQQASLYGQQAGQQALPFTAAASLAGALGNAAGGQAAAQTYAGSQQGQGWTNLGSSINSGISSLGSLFA